MADSFSVNGTGTAAARRRCRRRPWSSSDGRFETVASGSPSMSSRELRIPDLPAELAIQPGRPWGGIPRCHPLDMGSGGGSNTTSGLVRIFPHEGLGSTGGTLVIRGTGGGNKLRDQLRCRTVSNLGPRIRWRWDRQPDHRTLNPRLCPPHPGRRTHPESHPQCRTLVPERRRARSTWACFPVARSKGAPW